MFCLGKRKKKKKNKFRSSDTSSLNSMFDAFVELKQEVSHIRQEIDYLPVHSVLESYHHHHDDQFPLHLRKQKTLPIPERSSSLTWWKTPELLERKQRDHLVLAREKLKRREKVKESKFLSMSWSPSLSLKPRQYSEFLN